MRLIHHSGPVAVARSRALPCRAHPVTLTLRGGVPLDHAMTDALGGLGFAAGYLRLDGAQMARLDYVRPARASGQGHAAWYSETYQLRDAGIAQAGAHLGLRDGRAFVHCHGLWGGAAGHMLVADSVLACDTQVIGWGLSGAILVAEPDAETLFTLFQPAPAPDRDGGLPALLATLRPNQDVAAGIVGLAAQAGFQNAQVEGIGSTVGADLIGGAITESYGTEFLITEATVQRGSL
ncbi:MAG: hypothetical protein ACK4HW_13290, partial [Roseinatronobacter sp.]